MAKKVLEISRGVFEKSTELARNLKLCTCCIFNHFLTEATGVASAFAICHGEQLNLGGGSSCGFLMQVACGMRRGACACV
eukprot:7312972-Alexandrium_andersonii.AAC.2